MYNLGNYQTEIIGISAEIAIADHYNILVNPKYRKRSNPEIVKLIIPMVEEIFNNNNIPAPTKHIAESLNPIDFTLIKGKTLSVKTNQKKLGKVAPQIVGQPTAKTYFKYFKDLITEDIPKSYEDKATLFKKITLNNIDIVIKRYWDFLFHCDYMIYFYNFLDINGVLTNCPQSLVLSKMTNPIWVKEKFSFTQQLSTWNESNTVKYDKLAIGEFQVHNNRDNFKFRFNMNNILLLLNQGKL